MKPIRLSAGLAGLLLFAVLPTAAQNPSVTLRPVKYAGLAETVVQNRGKVVVVDFWGFF